MVYLQQKKQFDKFKDPHFKTFSVTYATASLQLFHKSVTILPTISVKASNTSGISCTASSREVLDFSTNPATAADKTEEELKTPSLTRSNREEKAVLIASIIRSNKYSKHVWIMFLIWSRIRWLPSPGTLRTWIICTRSWAVVVKMRRVIRFDNVLKMEKMSLSRMTAIDGGGTQNLGNEEFSCNETSKINYMFLGNGADII